MIKVIVLLFSFLYSCNDRCDDLIFPDQLSSLYVLPFPIGTSNKLFQGYCNSGGHRNRIAYDFFMPFGAEITNSRKGVVIEIQNNFQDDDNLAGHNNRVLIRHEDGSIAWCAHLKYKSVNLSVDDTLDYGELIGLCGTSGRSGNIPHLHFEVFNKIKYDYSDAIPISFRNLKGKVDSRGALIRNQNYEALSYDLRKWNDY